MREAHSESSERWCPQRLLTTQRLLLRTRCLHNGLAGKDMADHGKARAAQAAADEKRWKHAWQRMNKKTTEIVGRYGTGGHLYDPHDMKEELAAYRHQVREEERLWRVYQLSSGTRMKRAR